VASPRIQVLIDGSAEGLQRAVAKARKQLGELEDKLDGVGGKKSRFGQLGDAATNLAENQLGPLGDALGSVGGGLDGLSGPQMAAAAGMAALGTAAVASIRNFTELADRVRDFSTKTGMTTFESSRLIANMDDLGISTDTGAAALGRLARNIDAGKLDEYGISVVRAKDGTVNMAATLGNVADAIAATTDPTKRATLGNDLLGKSYAELLPLLNKGSQGMAEFADSVSKAQTLSEADLKASRDLQIALDNLKESGSDVGLTFAKETVPALALMASDLAKATGAVSNATNGLLSFADVLSLGMGPIGPTFQFYSERAKRAKDSTDELNKAQDDQGDTAETTAEQNARLSEEQRKLAREAQNAKDAIKAEKDALDRLDRKQNDMIDAALGFAGAQMAEWRASKDMKQALDELANGTGDYGERLADAEDKVQSYVEKSWAMYETQQRLAGVTLTAADKASFFRDKMADLIKDVQDPNVRAQLMNLAQLISGVTDSSNEAAGSIDSFRRQIKTMGYSNLLAAYAELGIEPPANLVAASNAVTANNADGGPVRAGMPTMVGEVGPELFVPQSNGRILSADDLARVGPVGGQGVTIVVNSPIGRPDDVVRWMREELRRLDRGQR
jgi:hypothetical protein